MYSTFKKVWGLPHARLIMVVLIAIAIVTSALLTTFSIHKAFADDGHGATYLQVNKGNGLCMDAGPSSNWYEGAHPYMYTCDTNNPNQQWFSRGINDPNYNYAGTIESAVAQLPDGEKLCLDHSNIQNQEGFLPYLWPCYNGPGQAWSTLHRSSAEGSDKTYGNIYPAGPIEDSSDLSGDTTAHNDNVYFINRGAEYSDDPFVDWSYTYVAPATY